MKAAATLARLAASGSSGVPTRLCSARLSLLEPPTTCAAGCGWVAAIFSASRLPPEVTISSSAAERLSELPPPSPLPTCRTSFSEAARRASCACASASCRSPSFTWLKLGLG